METIAFKSNWKHATLEFLIKELDTSHQDLSRSAISNRAIDLAESVENWGEVREELSRLQRLDNISIAASMQVKPDEERAKKIKAIREKMLSDLKDLSQLRTAYMILLLWQNYLLFLKEEKMKVGAPSSTTDLSGPEMVKRLVQILLLNRTKDMDTIRDIKKILLEWEE